MQYTVSIRSLEDLLKHLELNALEAEVGRGQTTRSKLAPLYWSRAAAHIMVGRYQSAVSDCELALQADPEWRQVRR